MGDVVGIAGWDAVGVARAPEKSCMVVDRAGRFVDEAMTQACHEADPRLRVFADVTCVACLVAAAKSQASGEMSVLGKRVEQ